MKKALLALSIAATLTGVAQAENATTLYGSISYNAQVARNDSGSHLNSTDYDLTSDTTILGVKGTEDLSNGSQVFYKFETYLTNSDTDEDTTYENDYLRYAYVGLTGDWGTLTLGKQDSLYKVVTNYNDIFENTTSWDMGHFAAITGGSRPEKTISYVSPSFAGVQVGAAGILDGQHDVVDGKENNFNAAQAGVWYNQNGYYAGVAYDWTSQEGGSANVTGVNLGYSNDIFQVGLGAEHANHLGSSVGEKYNLGAEYYMGPNTFRAGVSYSHTTAYDVLVSSYGDDANVALTGDSDQKYDIYTAALGYQYNFSERTYSWVEGQYINYDSDIQYVNDDLGDGFIVRVGLRHDF